MMLAEEMKDRARLRRWRTWYEKGVRNFEKLWNGEYYVLWREMRRGGAGAGRLDECCMTDQIDGDWFTALMGWGSVLPPDRVRAALRAILKYNYDPEDGLRNASYPPGKKTRLSTYKNFQADGLWSGIEYAIASMMIDYGMASEGKAVAKTVYDRYLRAGRVWNHVECGNYYYRAMSSWALLLSLSGFRIDAPAQKLTFAPAQEENGDSPQRQRTKGTVPILRFRAPFVTCTAWGHYTHQFTADGVVIAINCRSGRQALRELCLGAIRNPREVRVKLNDARISGSMKSEHELTGIIFARTLTLEEGDTLTIEAGGCRLPA
jgi:hypothetical protein